jgi:hypothetical protein
MPDDRGGPANAIERQFATQANGVQRRMLDVAFLHEEKDVDSEYKLVERESLVAIPPDDHPLAAGKTVHLRDFVCKTFIGIDSACAGECPQRLL